MLAPRRQGRVPLHCARMRDKTSKQSRPRFYKCGNFLEQQINAELGRKRHPMRERAIESRGVEEERRHRDNPAAAIVCFPRAGEQGSGESQINLSFGTFLLSPAALPSPSQSTMEGVSRLARSTIRTGITFTHFPWRGKVTATWKRVWNWKLFLTASRVIEVPGKRRFFMPLPNSLAAQLDLLTGKTEQQNPDKNKTQTENLFSPYRQRDLHSLASNPLVIQASSCYCSEFRNYCNFGPSKDF